MPEFKIAQVMKYKDDPTKSGRVQIRIYNEQNDEQQVKDQDLAWAILGMPTTNPSTLKLGSSPHGLKPGSRVLVTYMPNDLAEQYPIIIASLPRGDKPKSGGVSKNRKDAKEHSGGKIEKPGIDNPTRSKKENDKKSFDNGKTIRFNQTALKQQKPKIAEGEVKYAEPPVHEEDDKKLSDVREKLAKNADKPTTASAEQGQKDLPQILQQIDPQKKAQVLPQLYQQMQSMQSIMKMGMGGGAGGGGGGQSEFSQSSTSSGIKNTMHDSFTGALAILVRKYGFERVIDIFTKLLNRESINLLKYDYKDVVTNSLSNLIKLALYFGPLNIPVSQYEDGIFGDNIPPNDKIVLQAQIPDLWRKVYYVLSLDPYPGYQEWVSYTNSNDKLWVKKPEVHYYFSSSSQEIYYTSEKELAEDLDPYFMFATPEKPSLIITMEILNSLLDKQRTNVETNTMNNALGNNSGNQNSGGGGGGGAGQALGMLQGMLGGQLQQLLQGMQTDMMQKTVLTGEVQKGLQEFTKHMGITNQLFELGNSALGGGMGGLGSLMNMGGIGNILGGFGIGGGGIGGVLGNVTGGAGLLGDFGGFGGGSGGGGGAAGSGFPTAGFGQYNGGNVTDKGLTNIEDLLKLLGVTYE